MATLGATFGAPATAAANIAAVSPLLLGGPATLGPTPVVVEREQLGFSCEERRSLPRCTFEAWYFLHNPTRLTRRVVAAFYGPSAGGVVVRVDGHRSQRRLTAAEVAALDRSVWGTARGRAGPMPPRRGRTRRGPTRRARGRSALPWGWGRRAAAGRRGFSFTIAPGARRRVLVTGRLTLRRRGSHGFVIPARLVRHLALASRRPAGRFTFAYLLSPLRAWGGSGPIEVAVRHPAAWTLDGSLARTRSAPDRALLWDREEEGEVVVSRTRFASRDAETLTLGLVLPEPTLAWGGPIFGLGGAVGDRGGFRMRLGYEVSAPGWLFHSLQVDTDLRSSVVVAPVVEAVSPSLVLLPWVGVGVGMPIRLHPSTDVGVRFQTSLGWAGLAFVASFDFYPGLPSSHPERWRATLFGQLSF